MKVTVYGPGCARCVKTAEIVRDVLEAEGIPVQLEKVSDYAAIAAAGVLTIVPGAIVIWFVRHYIAKGFAMGRV